AAEAETRIQRLRGEVARPHFKEQAASAAPARKVGRLAQQRAPMAAALVARGNRQIEKVRLAHRDQQDEIADQLALQAPDAAIVAGAQGVAEIAARPRM